MKVSYPADPLGMSGRRKQITACITSDPGNCGEPVIVLENGNRLDIDSWLGRGYRIVEATDSERQLLASLIP